MKATHGNIDAVSRIRQLSILCTGHQNSALHVTMVALNFVPRMTMVATLPDDGWIELHAGWNGFGQASDNGGCQTANCSACTGGVWEVVSNTELSKLWYIYTEASFISCLLINTCILYLITIHNMESVLIFYIVSGSSLWFIYWYWYHNGEYLYFPPSLLIRELIKDFWTILGYLPRGKWVTNKLSHWRRVANHMHICINIRSKRSHHWYW